MTAPRVIDAHVKEEDQIPDAALRPRSLIAILDSKKSKSISSFSFKRLKNAENPWNTCSSTAPGTRKTTLAHVLAHEMGVNIRITSGPAIERAGDLGAILTNLEQGDILLLTKFIGFNEPLRKLCIRQWRRV